MSPEELKKYMENKRKNMSEGEFFALTFDMLEGNPAEDTRDILTSYLLTYSYIDRDRVARYLKPFLDDPSPIRKEFAALRLSLLVNGPDSLAYQILADYLGQAPLENEGTDIILDRLKKIFPLQDVDE